MIFTASREDAGFMRLKRREWMGREIADSPVFIPDPYKFKGRWNDVFDTEQPIYLELGCGKGQFIADMGSTHPGINFLGIDLTTAVLASASRKIRAAYGTDSAPNLKITAYDIGRLPEIMDERDMVDRIYINFCNPWTKKKKQKKRRLTHPRQLALYKGILSHGGEIHFKTDDDMLFDESVQYFSDDDDFEIKFITRDLHSEAGIESPMTEHEKMFTELGIKTKYMTAVYK